MCQAFAEHLLGKDQFEESTRALLKSGAFFARRRGLFTSVLRLVPAGEHRLHAAPENNFRDHRGLGRETICRIEYKAMWDAKVKTLYVKPYKLFSHNDTIYLHGGWVRPPERNTRNLTLILCWRFIESGVLP